MKKCTAMLMAFIFVISGCRTAELPIETPSQTPQQIGEVQESVPSETLVEDAVIIVEEVPIVEEITILEEVSTIKPVVMPDDSSFEIIFLDVGQADSALISCDGEYMLIDGGNVADSSLIYSVLNQRSITELAIVVGTHAHEDHLTLAILHL